MPNGGGIVALRRQSDHIDCRLTLGDLRDLAVAISRCRRLLDLDADPVAVDEQRVADPHGGGDPYTYRLHPFPSERYRPDDH